MSTKSKSAKRLKRNKNNPSAELSSREPIAIIGIGCRFPGGVTNPAEFWRMLRDGVDSISEVPADRWNVNEFYRPDQGIRGMSYAKRGGFIEGIDLFEPEVFGISPREAPYIDPQQRLLLEAVWEALEDAGLLLTDLDGSPTGVYVGISTDDYSHLQASAYDRPEMSPHSMTGGAFSIAANRISYCFNLKGPSIAIDTACSSSLIAVHLACNSIWDGRCELALAGGVNVIILPSVFIGFSSMAMLSPDGKCKTFDAEANGFVRGEGVGMVVLKALQAAIRDGDPIYALICATGTNQDGRTGGITLPNRDAQEELLSSIYEHANIPPESVRFVEAHGTGTRVGDPIEATAIGNALGRGRGEDEACVLCSVKTNIGHLEAAAGIAGLIKTALALKNRTIPPNLHFRHPNPDIDFKGLNLRVPVSSEPIAETPTPIYAGINSFGFGGSNAHVVLAAWQGEDKRKEAQAETSSRPFLLPLSARSAEAARGRVQKLKVFMEGSGAADIPLQDICFTASKRRNHFDHRAAFVCRNRDELLGLFESYLKDENLSAVSAGKALPADELKLAFVFSGQGSQWHAMGRQLLKAEPVFRQVIEECDKHIRSLSDWSLLAELEADEDHSRINDTAIAQPAIFAVQAGLTALLKSWGIVPDAVVGHSIGEIAASRAAGVFDLKEAARIAFHRGRSMDRSSSFGRMLALGVEPAEAKELIRGFENEVSIAAVNSPSSVTLAGSPAALQKLADKAEERDVFYRFLRVEYAFHSPMMEPVREDLLEALDDLHPGRASIPIYSTVTGDLIQGKEMDREYWWRNVRQSVLFYNAVDKLIGEGFTAFLEVSPHPVLSYNLKECIRYRGSKAVVLGSLKREEDEQVSLLSSLAALYSLGHALDWDGLLPQTAGYAHLPCYAWQRERYWSESEQIRQFRLGGKTHPLLKRDNKSAQPVWEAEIDLQVFPYLKDHQVQNQIVFPGAAYIEMALGAARELTGSPTCVLEEIDFKEVLFLQEGKDAPTVQLAFDPEDYGFRIFSREAGGNSWTQNACGRIRRADSVPNAARLPFEEIKQRCTHEFGREECYRWSDTIGLNYGPEFQLIERIWRREGEAIGLVCKREPQDETGNGYIVHPAVLDACFQTLVGTIPWEDDSESGTYIPQHIDRIVLHQVPGERIYSHAVLRRRTERTFECDIRACNEDGSPVLEIEGLACRLVAGMKGQKSEGPENWVYRIRWESNAPDHRGLTDTTTRYFAPLDIVKKRSEDFLSGLLAKYPWDQRYAAFERQIDELCHVYILNALRELGLKTRKGKRFSADSIIREFTLNKRFRGILNLFLKALESGGWLRRVDTEWVFVGKRKIPDPGKLWRRIIAEQPAFIAEMAMTSRVGRRLAEVLSGKTDVLQILFPEGSTDLAEHLYQDSPTLFGYNEMLAQAVATLIERVPESRIIRILEIGAGTGGLTRSVLPKLPRNRTEYVFSDISNLFFMKAEQRFRDYPFLEFKLLDIERDPPEQEFAANSFDLVLASDVLHATAHVRDALANIRKLLSPQGILLLIEGYKSSLWSDVVFGLTEGWWKFADHDLRPDHPFLSEEGWKGAFEEAGFSDVHSFSGLTRKGGSGQAVFIGKGPAIPIDADAPHFEIDQAGLPGRWLVFAENSQLSQTLVRALKERGADCTFLHPGSEYREIDGASFELHHDDDDALLALLERQGEPFTNVLYLWGSNGAPQNTGTPSSLKQTYTIACMGLVTLVKAYSRRANEAAPSLTVITSGVYPVAGSSCGVSPEHAPLSGLARVLINEHPEFNCKLIDLDPDLPEGDLQLLFKEMLSDSKNAEIAIREGTRFLPVVERVESGLEVSGRNNSGKAKAVPFRLKEVGRSVIDGLRYEECRRPKLEAGQVEIRVEATSLNFRDVLKALGLYPTEGDDYTLFGDECAGVVTRIGDGVTSLKEGDEVFAIAPGCFSAFACSDEGLFFKKPPHVLFEEAATLPIAFFTAYYCLVHVGRLQRGESILIHAATGGVGLAAIQVARRIGAEIFATASAGKQWMLRELGVKHIMDSRSVGFSDEIKELTGGKGVNIVLNSLAGEAILKGIEALAPYGRFIEIGKRDIYGNTKIGLRPFKNNISFHAVDLAKVLVEDPKLVRAIAGKLEKHFALRHFHPLPYRKYPASRIKDAFRQMSQAKHVGKLVVSMDDAELRVKSNPKRMRFREDASYLITGGFGGFGLLVASWMVERGARHLILAGRSGPATEEARIAVEELRKAGAEVHVAKTDVVDREQLDRLFDFIDAELPPLRGVFHAAMVLQDTLIAQTDEDNFSSVMEPKALGAWNLHSLTIERDLDFFVLFSSITPLVGNPGQASYAAANAYLDALAHHRRHIGLPATSICWGQLSEVGYVARHKEVEAQLAKIGSKSFTPEEALSVLELIMAIDPTHVGATSTSWQNMLKGVGAGESLMNRFTRLLGEQLEDAGGTDDSGRIRESLAKASPTERREIIFNYLTAQVAKVLGTSAGKIDPGQSLPDIGLDSLMAIELKNRIEIDLKISLPTSALIGSPSVNGLTDVLAGLGQVAKTKTVPAEKPGSISEPRKVDYESRVVEFKKDGSKPPIFLIHPSGGDVQVYTNLSRSFDHDHPIYSLPSRVLAGEETEHESGVEMAREYASLIQRKHPKGPYYCMGFSFGGMLSIGIAECLERQGGEVALVGLIDPDIRPGSQFQRDESHISHLVFSFLNALAGRMGGIASIDKKVLIESVTRLVRDTKSVSSDERVDRILAWYYGLGLSNTEVPEDYLKKFIFLLNKHLEILTHFDLGVIRAPIAAWKTRGALDDSVDEVYDWGRFTSGSYYEEILDGDHFSIMFPPQVNELAERIGRRISEMS